MMTTEVPSSAGDVSAPPIKFDHLKPVCCDVMKSPNPDALTRLLKTLEDLPSGSLTPEVINYVLFPLVVHLKSLNLLQPPARLLLLKCIEISLEKGIVENFKCFMDLFQSLCMILGLKSNEATIDFNQNLPEELVQNIEGSLCRLLENITLAHRDLLLDEPYVKSIGHAIYMQLQILNSELPLEIRLRSIEMVELFFKLAAVSVETSKRMLNFLPGVVIALRKASTVRARRAKTELIIRSLQAFTTATVVATTGENEENLSKVDQNLSILLNSMSQELLDHDDARLRGQLFCLSRSILEQRCGELPQCAKILWRNILCFCWDSEDEISCESRQFLSKNVEKTDLCNFENALDYMKAAKSHYIGGNLEEAVRHLKYLASCFCVKRLMFVEISALFPPLANFLTIAIVKNEFDLDKEAEETLYRPNPLLKICNDLCTSISFSATVDDIFEEVIPYFTFNVNLELTQRLENNFLGALYLFNKVLLAYVSSYPDNVKSQDLLTLAALYIELLDKQSHERAKATPKISTILEYESVVVTIGLGIVSRADPSSVLSSALYYLLEQAGNEYSDLVSRVTLNVLVGLANAVQGSNLQEFLTSNLDLILSELSVRVGSISSYPNCPSALVFLANYFDFGKGEFVKLVQRAFTQSCDTFYTSSQKIFARIFYAYIYSLWLQRCKALSFSDSTVEELKSSESLGQRLINYQKSLGIEVSSSIEEIMDTVEDSTPHQQSPKHLETEEEMDVTDPESSLSSELKLALSICERVLNFLPTHEDRSVQILSMDCLIYGVQLLRKEENALLPLAHKIWPNLSSRFTDTDMTIVRKSFELLVILCKSSGSFLRKRIVQEVFPKLSSLLVSLAMESERVEQKNILYYTYTQAFKVQMAILEGIADLCLAIELSEEELDQVVSGCLVYCKPQQHKNLREAALRVIENFAKDEHSSSIIWMKLIAHGLRVPQVLIDSNEFLPLPQLHA